MKKIYHLFILLLIAGEAFCQGSQQVAITNYSTGQAFTSITVDTSGNVWAGTNKAGLFFLDKKSNPDATFSVITSNNLNTFVIQTVAADKSGRVWVGHGGTGGTLAAGGGIERININSISDIKHYSPDRNAECYSFLQRDGLATLNTSSIAVDKNNTVWAAQKSHSITSGADFILTPGSLSHKQENNPLFISKSTWEQYRDGDESPEFPYPAYTCNVPVTKTPGSRRCESVACSNNEVWVSVFGYEYTTERKSPGKEVVTEFLPARIIRYDLNGDYEGQITFDTVGAAPGGIFNSIYLTSNGNAWVGLSASKGFATRINGCWKLLNSQNLTDIFVAGASVNTNSIWGNNQGQVFIGTNKGLIVYNGVGKIDDPASYTLYTTANSDLVSDNITGGASEKDSIQWVATDMGISRIKSGNNFSLDKNYTFCNNKSIDSIEAQTKYDLNPRWDYHKYTVTTDICSKEGPNGSNCNAQYVYNMMKADASLTAPTPVDFPMDFDPFSVGLLKIGADQLEIISRSIIASKVPIISVAFIGIDIADAGNNTKSIPFGHMLNTTKDYLALQKSVNPAGVEECKKYLLYNNPTFIIGRTKWNKYVENLFCGDQLESVEYDAVWIFPDDKNLTIANYTAPGHFLYPGKIVRTVVEECGKVKVITKGTGLQYCGDNLFGGIAGIGNIITGEILFHNIDIRLKTAFEKKGN